MKNRRLKLKAVRGTYVRIADITRSYPAAFDPYGSVGISWANKGRYHHLTNTRTAKWRHYKAAMIRHPELQFGVSTAAYGLNWESMPFPLGDGYIAIYLTYRGDLSDFWKTFDSIKGK